MKLLYLTRRSFPALFLICSISSQAQLTVDSTFSPTLMVQALLGGGITVANITYTGDTIHASGFFNEPGGAFGITNGIMLTSGTLSNVPGPNNLDDASQDNLQAGDLLLDQYTTGFTQDATILEFDFTPVSDSVEFNYVFASEEYNEFVDQGFNDVFGFFISGPGIVGQKDIALVPGTNTPCSIDSINNGYTITGQASAGPCTNCQYYVDNFMGTVMQYDGYTTVLTARAGVIPCETYHLKLAIADVTDGVYDSGVFLEGGSFKSTGIFQVAYNGGDAPGTLHLCPGTCATLTAPYMYNYNWNTGDTNQSIVVCAPGLFYVSTTNGACTATSASVNVIAGAAAPAVTISNALDVLTASIIDTVNYSYQWYQDGILYAGATSPSLTLTVNGCYYLQLTNLDGCSSLSDTICDQSVGMVENSALHFSVRPNPSNGTFTIEGSGQSGNGDLQVMDLSGRIVYAEKWTGNSSARKIEATHLTEGIYFLQLKTERGVYTQRIVIQ